MKLMKTFDKLTNEDKVRMLYDMFPEEITPTVEAISRISDSVRDNFDQIKKDWAVNSFMTAEYWLDCVLQCKRFVKDKKSIIEACSGQHFFFFTLHCIQQYAINTTKDKDFKRIAYALFSIENGK